MKHIKDLLSFSAAPYHKALLKKNILIQSIMAAAHINLLPKSISFSKEKITIKASAVIRSEIFSKIEKIRKEFEARSGEKLPPFI